MFNSIKTIKECKKILKKYGIKYCKDFSVFKRFGLIHCQVEDWRGPIEIDGFPVFTEKAAVGLLVESCAFSHYCNLEKDNRENLTKEYQLGYGEYEPRKFIFESILNVLKDYDKNIYQASIEKYTKHINTNRTTKDKWFFNADTKEFETYISPELFAVIIYKTTHYVNVYNQDPSGGRHYDNIYTFLSSDAIDNILTFTFSNNGTDRFYLSVHNPDFCNESKKYILIGKADKIVWTHNCEAYNHKEKRTRTFVFDGQSLDISEDISNL
jgi:hypothetical protein